MELLRSRQDLRLEKIFVRSDGAEVPVELRAAPPHADGGHIVVHVEPRLRPPVIAQGDASADQRRELECVANLVSHDFRQYGRMVSSSMGAILQRHAGNLEPSGRELLRLAESNAKHLVQCLGGLADYLRIGLDRTPIASASAQAAWERAIAELAPLIAACAARIDCQPLPEVRADPDQLAMVFRHLLENAAVHHGPGAPGIQVHCQRDERAWRFTVSDDGPGIAADLRPRVFQPFFSTRSAPPELRLGLGLAVSRAVIERHGGRLWIDDLPRAGASVSFTLPDEASR